MDVGTTWSYYLDFFDTINFHSEGKDYSWRNERYPYDYEFFNEGNGYPDDELPSMDNWTYYNYKLVTEFTTLLHLKKGYHTLGATVSSRLFQMYIGPNFDDLTNQGIPTKNTGDMQEFNILVKEDGLYPFRILTDAMSKMEIFSIVDEEKILINDLKNENSIKAYITINSLTNDFTQHDDTGRAKIVSIEPNKNENTRSNKIKIVAKNGSKTSFDQATIKMTLNGKSVKTNIESNEGPATNSMTK